MWTEYFPFNHTKKQVETTNYVVHCTATSTRTRRSRRMYGRGLAKCHKMALRVAAQEQRCSSWSDVHKPAQSAPVLPRVRASSSLTATNFHPDLSRYRDAGAGEGSWRRRSSVGRAKLHQDWSSGPSQAGCAAIYHPFLPLLSWWTFCCFAEGAWRSIRRFHIALTHVLLRIWIRERPQRRISAGDERISHVELIVVVSLNRVVRCYVKSYRSEVEGM